MQLPSGFGLFALRLGLLLAAAGWGVSFYFTFASWPSAAGHLKSMGGEWIEYRPMLDYWLRMASVVFGMIGVACALAWGKPKAFASLIGLLGPFHVLVGLTLVMAARQNDLNPAIHRSFIPDITFCFLVGALIQIPLLHVWLTKQSEPK